MVMIRSFKAVSYRFCNLYKILNVERDADSTEIKNSYFELAKKHHPDTASEESSQFIRIKTAYDTLKDPEKRKQYDYELVHGTPMQRKKYAYYYSYPQASSTKQQTSSNFSASGGLSFIIFSIAGIVAFGWFLRQYSKPMTGHEIRRQNIILANQNIESPPSVQQKRRKMFLQQMKEKKITTKVVDLKIGTGAAQTTKAKNVKKNSIEAIEGINKQKKAQIIISGEQYI